MVLLESFYLYLLHTESYEQHHEKTNDVDLNQA